MTPKHFPKSGHSLSFNRAVGIWWIADWRIQDGRNNLHLEEKRRIP
jgi:hypothetical protein